MSGHLFDRVCTIYSKATKVDVNTVCSFSGDNTFSVEETAADWTKIVFRGAHASLTLNKTVYLGPGFTPPNGYFNKAVMGAHNYFRTIKTAHTDAQRSLVTAITKVKTLIGCVAEPAMSEEDGHYDIIFALAARFDGMIFDSDAMLDANGVVILDKSGRAGFRRGEVSRKRPTRS
jgi:hypothetical protein